MKIKKNGTGERERERERKGRKTLVLIPGLRAHMCCRRIWRLSDRSYLPT